MKKPLSISRCQLGLSKSFISKYFRILLKKQILKKEKGKLVVADNASVKAVKILLNVRRIDTRIFGKYPFVTAVGLYGSCARDENTEDSDVDLWVRVKDVEESKIASLTSEVNKKIKNTKLFFLNDKKIEKLRKEDTMFYHSLSFGSIILYGDKDAVSV
ncbi:MAG: nucleotidyltransferase domain-containing protein [Nitrospirae bacterium]|nr:nucleotidyltransferase domain-containing protein [Nitrospirota bacterium]